MIFFASFLAISPLNVDFIFLGYPPMSANKESSPNMDFNISNERSLIAKKQIKNIFLKKSNLSL